VYSALHKQSNWQLFSILCRYAPGVAAAVVVTAVVAAVAAGEVLGSCCCCWCCADFALSLSSTRGATIVCRSHTSIRLSRPADAILLPYRCTQCTATVKSDNISDIILGFKLAFSHAFTMRTVLAVFKKGCWCYCCCYCCYCCSFCCCCCCNTAAAAAAAAAAAITVAAVTVVTAIAAAVTVSHCCQHDHSCSADC
jgi:hypothetical protein